MATFDITLSQEELLQVFLSEDSNSAMQELVRRTLNEFLRCESDEQLKAERYEHTAERADYRNGMRERQLTTRIGTFELEVPRHRNQPFRTMLFETYQRSEAALVTTMAEMVIAGVSTRKVAKVMETLCGKEFSKSTVSEACTELDKYVNDFRNRPIEPGKYPFIMLDATYFKCREDGRISPVAFMVAIGITGDGKREVIGFGVYDDESDTTWDEFLQSLVKRGLQGVRMFTSDAHKSIRKAVWKCFPNAAWQRCQFHFMKNILDTAPKKYRKGLESELHEMFNAQSEPDARKLMNEIVNDYSEVAEKSMEILENGFDDAMTVFTLPEEMRTTLRTSNAMERLNGELKRRSNVIKIFPNRESVLRLMGTVTMRQHDILLGKRGRFYKCSMDRIPEGTLLTRAARQRQADLAA